MPDFQSLSLWQTLPKSLSLIFITLILRGSQIVYVSGTTTPESVPCVTSLPSFVPQSCSSKEKHSSSLACFFLVCIFILLSKRLMRPVLALFQVIPIIHHLLLRKVRRSWSGRVRGRTKREGIHVCIWLIHDVVQQKLIQHCKVITFK